MLLDVGHESVAAAVVADDVAVVVVLVDEPERGVVVEELVVVVDVMPAVRIVAFIAYRLRRLGPPQYSVLLPPHVIEQSVVLAMAEPVFKLLPQKHCVEYSTPNALKPEQYVAHCSTVILEPVCPLDDSARPEDGSE